uniref:Neutral protease 2 n=1 Tax=Colletotrichum fructicola (strain Nara gc5) TaxID=1213859 RepID=L2GK12_COLFN
MKFSLGVSLLATLASAVSVDIAKRDTSPLDVKLETVGNSGVKAVLTNTGDSALKLFKTGTILDTAPVEKVEVFASGNKVEFDGVRLLMATSGLTEEAFQVIGAGESVEVEFDAAELHDLSTAGEIDIVSSGAFSYAEADSTELAGTIPFSSNSVHTAVNGEEAAAVRARFLAKRTVNAISRCRSLAVAASSAAASGPAARMTEYFKSSTTATRNTVATVFSRIASECGSTTSGVSRQYCTDVYPACSNGVIAYTLLHEMTHLTQIRGTSDYGGYGYNFVRSLSASQNLNHADTYTLFAQSIYAGC